MFLNNFFVFQTLYFKYMYNNFLHSQVEACITTILNSSLIEEANESIVQENMLVKYVRL